MSRLDEASGKDEISLKLNSPITEEQWDAITDVDFEYTDRIWFSTKHGKKVEFVKRKTGTWNRYYRMHSGDTFVCNRCGSCFVVIQGEDEMNFCPNCGADMRGEQDALN